MLTPPYYAILRLIPTKLVGVLFMFGSLAALLVVTWTWTTFEEYSEVSIDSSVRFKGVYKVLF